MMTKQPPPLVDRIDFALQPDAAVTSADLAALIEEAETYIAKADRLWMTVDRTSPLDPVIMGATSTAEQLRLLLPKLQTRYEQVQEQEQSAAFFAAREAVWRTKYDELKHERDALAEELREVYPNAARKIGTYSAASPPMIRRCLSCISLARLAWSSICVQPSCMPVDSKASVTTHLRFSLRCTSSIGTPATESGHCHGHQWHRRSLQPQFRLLTGALPQIGRKTTTGVPQHIRRSNSEWQPSTRAKRSSKRRGRMRKRGNVSPRFSAKTVSIGWMDWG
jgi:hypothetical protein